MSKFERLYIDGQKTESKIEIEKYSKLICMSEEVTEALEKCPEACLILVNAINETQMKIENEMRDNAANSSQ